jgi:hypothetical protein
VHPIILITSSWPKHLQKIFSNAAACSNTNSRTPLHQLISWGGCLSFDKGLDLFELYQLLLNAGADEILIDNIDIFRSYRGPVNNLKYLQRQAYPPYHRTPLPLRLAVAAHQLEFFWHNSLSALETLLDIDGEINAEIAEWTNEKGQTLLYLVWRSFARRLANVRGIERYLDRSLETQDLETIEDIRNIHSCLHRRFSRKLISAGASLQSVDNDGHTLLTGVIYRFYVFGNDYIHTSRWNPKEFLEALNEILEDWLFSLLKGGVDLQEYGAWESLSLQNKDFGRPRRYYEEDEPDENGVCYNNRPLFEDFDIRLINVKYGPSPKDWIFWFSEPSDPFAGDFWAMIEGEEHWRMFEKGWFLDVEDGFAGSRGWYFDEEATGPDEEAASIDVLPMPGLWSSEF